MYLFAYRTRDVRKYSCNPRHARLVMDSIILIGEYGALLQYPPTLRVKLVEEPFGHIQSSHSPKRKRSKKRRKLNAGEESQIEYHIQIRERLLLCYSRICEASKTVHYFPVQQLDCTIPPSCTGKEYKSSNIDFVSLCNLASLTPICDLQEQPVILNNDLDSQRDIDVFGKVISNTSDQHINISTMTKEFSIPPRSTFLLSNLSHINPLYEYAARADRYDIIVIDPPWENRSAIRAKKYLWLPADRLLDISLPRLAAKGALVAVWVTNKRKLAMFVEHTLFPKWHVHYLTEWHWLKVTTGGDLIHDMDSVHKKPYEIVVIGHYLGKQTEDVQRPLDTATNHGTTQQDSCDAPPPSKQLCPNEDLLTANDTSESISEEEPTFSHSTSIVQSPCYGTSVKGSCGVGCNTIHDTIASFSNQKANVGDLGCICTSAKKYLCVQEISMPELYRPFVFMCPVSRIHSQKPYLGDVLKKYFNKQGRQLELFARSLLPEWTSWGNEVLKFQEVSGQDVQA